MTSIIYVGGGKKKTKFHKGTEIVTSWRGRGGSRGHVTNKILHKVGVFWS